MFLLIAKRNYIKKCYYRLFLVCSKCVSYAFFKKILIYCQGKLSIITTIGKVFSFFTNDYFTDEQIDAINSFFPNLNKKLCNIFGYLNRMRHHDPDVMSDLTNIVYIILYQLKPYRICNKQCTTASKQNVRQFILF